MLMTRVGLLACVPLLVITLKAAVAGPRTHAVLWRRPAHIGRLDLVNGPGGAVHQPKGPFKWVKEDISGSSPKYVVTDIDGVKWKIKLGDEAHPEVAASRLVWAAGYFTDEDYFLPVLKVNGVPLTIKRGANRIEPDGLMHDARLKRYKKGEEKEGNWSWKSNPFAGTRELNGLRVMMALINNWDLKDVNNAIVRQKDGRLVYMVSDLGATFGTTHFEINRAAAKGNLKNYADSRFIRGITPATISFAVPGRPEWLDAVNIGGYKKRVGLEWIGRDIPIADARWIGNIMAQLSPRQIQDAFGAAGYSPRQVVGFSRALEERIAELNSLYEAASAF